MPILNVGGNLIQDERDNVWFHRQEEHITVLHSLLVVGRQVHPHLLQGVPRRAQPAVCGWLAPLVSPQAESPSCRTAQRMMGTWAWQGWGLKARGSDTI